jgi:thiamine-phosphate pyrophosphorylase
MKSYLITDPKYYKPDIDSFSKYLENIYKNKQVDFACFRDKKNKNAASLASVFVKISKKYGIDKILINGDIELSLRLKVFGVHLRSSQLDLIEKAKKSSLFVIASTHSLDEAILSENAGADAITFSPIFWVEDKGKPVGLEKLKEIIDKIHIDCFALGGILTKEQIFACKEVGAYGFASIRYFTKGI